MQIQPNNTFSPGYTPIPMCLSNTDSRSSGRRDRGLLLLGLLLQLPSHNHRDILVRVYPETNEDRVRIVVGNSRLAAFDSDRWQGGRRCQRCNIAQAVPWEERARLRLRGCTRDRGVLRPLFLLRSLRRGLGLRGSLNHNLLRLGRHDGGRSGGHRAILRSLLCDGRLRFVGFCFLLLECCEVCLDEGLQIGTKVLGIFFLLKVWRRVLCLHMSEGKRRGGRTSCNGLGLGAGGDDAREFAQAIFIDALWVLRVPIVSVVSFTVIPSRTHCVRLDFPIQANLYEHTTSPSAQDPKANQ